MSHSIQWEKSGVCIAYQGVVSFDDFMGAVFAIHQNSNYSTMKYAIHDMSGADQIDFSGVDMTHIVAHELGARYTNPRIKASVVATSFTMSEMIKTFTSMTKLDVQLFAGLQQARDWSEMQSA